MKKPYWHTDTYKLATCCLFDREPLSDMNMGTCTLTSAKKSPDKAITKAYGNCLKLIRIYSFLATQPTHLRYWRLSGEIFPCYTAPDFQKYYDGTVMKDLAKLLVEAGDIAKKAGIRTGSHPAQFTVLASDKSHVVDASINDLEYHATIFELMGLKAEEVSVNIHLQGLYGGEHIDGIKRFAKSFKRLSKYSQKCLTVENEDKPNGYGIDHVLQLADKIPIRVMYDHHHHCCYTMFSVGTIYPKIHDVISTWGNIRPAMHVSESKIGANIRAHSDYITDPRIVNAIKYYTQYFDIEIEAKAKWSAVNALFRELESTGI